MTELAELAMRVTKLETWAGPGQAEALAAGLRALRADVADIRRVQRQHTAQLGRLTTDVAGLTTDVAGLTTDVAGLKAAVTVLTSDVAVLKSDVADLKSDVADLKVAVREILRRLPEPPAS